MVFNYVLGWIVKGTVTGKSSLPIFSIELIFQKAIFSTDAETEGCRPHMQWLSTSLCNLEQWEGHWKRFCLFSWRDGSEAVSDGLSTYSPQNTDSSLKQEKGCTEPPNENRLLI